MKRQMVSRRSSVSEPNGGPYVWFFNEQHKDVMSLTRTSERSTG